MEATTRINVNEIIDEYNEDNNREKLEIAIKGLMTQLSMIEDAYRNEVVHDLQTLLYYRDNPLGNPSTVEAEDELGGLDPQTDTDNIEDSNQLPGQEKVPRLVTISLAGLYSFKKREDFSLAQTKKMILVGPNNSGKSNLIRAILLCLCNAPNGPSREAMQEVKYSGPEIIKEPSFISLQFELAPSTIQFIADALIFPLMSQFPLTSVNEKQMNSLLELRDKIKSRIGAVHIICQEQVEQNSNGEQKSSYESFIAITPKVVERFVPFIDGDQDCVTIYHGSYHSLSLLSMCESLDPKLKLLAALNDEIRLALKQIFDCDAAKTASWLNAIEKIEGLNGFEALMSTLEWYHDSSHWKSNECLDIGTPLAKLLRSYVSILPQDRGLISFDRYNTNVQQFTIAQVIQSLTDASQWASNSIPYHNLKRIIGSMKELGIILSIPLNSIQACGVFVQETFTEHNNELIQGKIRSLLEKCGNAGNFKIIYKRMLAFLNLPDFERTADRARNDLLSSHLVPDILNYEKECNLVFANLLEREVGIDSNLPHRYESAYHDINPTLKEYAAILFSTIDNPLKKLSLGALYGAAQQFLIVYTALLMGNVGTVLLDEPEISMHASSKAILRRLLQSSKSSLIIVTHAEELISEQLLDSTYHFARVKASTVVTSVAKVLAEISPQKPPVRAISNEVRPLFFVDRVLFVEGPNDIRFFNALQHLVNEDFEVRRKLSQLKINLKKLCSWYTINLDGCENAPSLGRLAEYLVPWCVIVDRDVLENKKAKDTHGRNKRIYALIDAVNPKMKIYEQIEQIVNEDRDIETQMKMNAEMEDVEYGNGDKKFKKSRMNEIKKLYEDNLSALKVNKIRQIFDGIKQIFAWTDEMEHIFLKPFEAANVLHQNCDSEDKHPDVREFILQKTDDSLHDLWSSIKLSAIIEAVKLLILNENKELISLCRHLTNF